MGVKWVSTQPANLTKFALGGLQFNGEDNYVEVPTLKYDGSHPITLEGWVVAETLPRRPVDGPVRLEGVVTSNLGPGGEVVGVSFSPQREFVKSSPTSALLVVGKPEHVALVWDGKKLRQFVGGVAEIPWTCQSCRTRKGCQACSTTISLWRAKSTSSLHPTRHETTIPGGTTARSPYLQRRPLLQELHPGTALQAGHRHSRPLPLR